MTATAHIIHWEDGGPTDTWNLVALCPYHHRLHHQGKLGISGDADASNGLTFTMADGELIPASGARPTPGQHHDALSPPVGTYRHPSGERLEGRWLYFNPPPGYRHLTLN